MSEFKPQPVLHFQVSMVSKTLEELRKTNQEICRKLSQQTEDVGKANKNVHRAKEILINLQIVAKRDKDREKSLQTLEKKVNKLYEKVETLNQRPQTRQSVKRIAKTFRTNVQKTESARICFETPPNCDASVDSKNGIKTEQINSCQETTKIQYINKESESELFDTSHYCDPSFDSENGIKTGQINTSQEATKIQYVSKKNESGDNLKADAFVLPKEVTDHTHIKNEQFLTETLKKDNVGFRFKVTERNIDNRIRMMYGEKSAPGKLLMDTLAKHQPVYSSDIPTKNVLHNGNEVSLVQKLGTKPKTRSEMATYHSSSRSDLKVLRHPSVSDTVSSIVDLNTWRSIAEKERKRGVYSDAPKNEAGLDTCLLLDISESMIGGTFDEMIRRAKLYVQGIEDISKTLPHFTENIGIATFGHSIGVVQYMTSDYKRIKDALDMLTPGGSSPMSAGLYMGLACCLGNKSVHLRSPPMYSKMIMFTDGNATSDTTIQSDTDFPPSDHTETLIINMTLEEASKDIGRRDFRVYCYAIGCENDTYLQTITENTEGKIYRGDDIHKLIRMTQTANVALGIRQNYPDVDNLDEATTKDLCQTMVFSGDFEEVIHLIRFFRNKMKSFVTPDEKRYNEASDSSLPPVGTRVRRGPDWSWGYQDTGGPGTVVGNSSPVWVEWDSGHLNIYKYHRMLGYDVTVVQEPRILGYDELIAVGCLVQRGANWKFGDQDGGKGNVGVVIKVEQNATVMVRWPNKKKAVYKYGNDGLFEIEICDPFKVSGSQGNLKVPTSSSGKQGIEEGNIQHETLTIVKKTPPLEHKKSETPPLTMKVSETNKSSTRKVAFADASWSYKKDDTWYVYPDNVNTKIEKAFQRNSQLCIVQLHGDIFQISYKKMVQICNKTGQVTQVKRDDKKGQLE